MVKKYGYKKQLDVVDINSGLGGRIIAFLNSDFNILATVNNKKDNFYYHNSQLKDIPHIISDFNLDTIDIIPKSDIISANYSLSSNTIKAHIDLDVFNTFLTQIILRDAPKAFIFQVPTTLLHRNDFNILKKSVLIRYTISYQVFKESDYSGYSVSGNQAYIVGIRSDIYQERFLFPAPPFHYTNKHTNFLAENIPSKIDPWYRILPEHISLDSPPVVGKFYTKNFQGKLIATDNIRLFTRNECYYCDEIGLRKLTHNEYAYLKGFTNLDYNTCTNRYDMYKKIFTEPNLYIFKPITDELHHILTENFSDLIPIDWPPFTVENTESKKRKNENKTKPSFKEDIIQPRNKIINIHIDKLKGLKNLDIDFNKNLTAIMGVNGVGKSTILHALACVFSPLTSNGQNHKFNFFFTPNPDALWNDSKFSITFLDENTQNKSIRNYQKKTNRWSPKYSQRPKRDVFYVGIESCLPEIERERQTSYITYSTDIANDKLSDRIIKSAAYILDKDYKELTYNKTKKKSLIGIRTSLGVNYSSLSMGAGEQRLIEILKLLYAVEPYSLILIDEIDLLLHVKALERLIKKISENAIRKNLQIIFTTHSLVMRKLYEFVDIRYLYQTKEKTMVLNSITPDIVFDISDESEIPLTIYVEDELSQTIITHILKSLSLSKYTSIKTFGAAENAFTLASGFILDGTSIENKLIVIDGDIYRTKEEKTAQIKRKLSGTENNHTDKLDYALKLITQFTLPNETSPEKFIYDMLIDSNYNDEITEYAKQLCIVANSHDWLNDIIKRINQDRSITLYQIIDNVTEHKNWECYIKNVREWLLEKKKHLKLDQ